MIDLFDPTCDLSFYAHIECCLLSAAEATLESYGLPAPGRVEGVWFGVKGDPACCDALVVSVGASRPASQGACHPAARVIDWEVRITRSVCQTDPECGEEPADCSENLLCPGDVWPETVPDGCETSGRQAQRRLLMADRTALETHLAGQAKCCVNENRWRDCGCQFACDEVLWQRSEPISGGGCAGTLLRFQTSTVPR